MNTEPVKALATTDKRPITWKDVRLHLSTGQEFALSTIAIMFGSAAIVGVFAVGMVYIPAITITAIVVSPLIYAGYTLWQAYREAKGG